MAIKVNIGGEFFDRIRQNGSYYVDKTELIYELAQESDNAVTLFTRPRRFGKTLMMTTMQSFFDIQRDSREVFRGLDITRHEEFCRAWMNQYPVLFLTLKDAEGLSFQSAYGMLKSAVSDVCKRHEYLSRSEKVSPSDAKMFEHLIFNRASDDEIKKSLLILTRMLAAHYGKPVILLIDEYDVPLAKANEEKEGGERYYPQMLEVIRSIMSAALKSNDYLKFAVITGCLRIAKESIFTGVNNFKSYSVLDRDFSTYFGFTDTEVKDLLKAADRENRLDLVRSWYDGYVFGNTKVYCPWDVMNDVADSRNNPDLRPKNYWKNTSGNGIIRDLVERFDTDVRYDLEALMNGESITKTISDELTYDTLHLSEDNLWSVLLMTGYLTKADPDEEGNTVALRIPNAEIAGIFQDTVAKYFSEHLDESAQKAMMTALWNGDEAAASKAISDFLWQTISYMDYHEDYYHAFLTGIFVGRGYAVESNREHGLGRPDIRLTDHRNRRILIIEAKKSETAAQMDHDCDEALKQIVDQEYAKGLDAYRVLCYGIAFYQKTALVKKL